MLFLYNKKRINEQINLELNTGFLYNCVPVLIFILVFQGYFSCVLQLNDFNYQNVQHNDKVISMPGKILLKKKNISIPETLHITKCPALFLFPNFYRILVFKSINTRLIHINEKYRSNNIGNSNKNITVHCLNLLLSFLFFFY